MSICCMMRYSNLGAGEMVTEEDDKIFGTNGNDEENKEFYQDNERIPNA